MRLSIIKLRLVNFEVRRLEGIIRGLGGILDNVTRKGEDQERKLECSVGGKT